MGRTSLPGFYLRFVGSDTLPKSLSRREVEECFGLSAEDIHELRPPRFRGTARLGAAVQLGVDLFSLSKVTVGDRALA